jgi:hypothetical protein
VTTGHLVTVERTDVVRVDEWIQFGPNWADFANDTPIESWAEFVENLKRRLRFADEGIPWILGDAINFAEHAYGEKYTQWVDETEYRAGTLRNMAWVARRWPPAERDQNKRYSDYRAAAPLRYEAPAVASKIVEQASANGQTHRQVLDQVSAEQRKLRAEGKIAPASELAPPTIMTGLHRSVCPTCTCSGSAPRVFTPAPKPGGTRRRRR